MNNRKSNHHQITEHIANVTESDSYTALQNASSNLTDADHRLLEARRHFKVSLFRFFTLIPLAFCCIHLKQMESLFEISCQFNAL